MFGVKAPVPPGHGFPEQGDPLPDTGLAGGTRRTIPAYGGAKKRLQAAVLLVTGPQAPAEVPQIVLKESPVDTGAGGAIPAIPQSPVVGPHNKGVRATPEQGKEAFAGFQDKVPPPPGDNAGQKGGYFDIRGIGKAAGEADRIGIDKFGPVGFPVPALKLLFKKFPFTSENS
jgi:hypothetical protein